MKGCACHLKELNIVPRPSVPRLVWLDLPGSGRLDFSLVVVSQLSKPPPPVSVYTAYHGTAVRVYFLLPAAEAAVYL